MGGIAGGATLISCASLLCMSGLSLFAGYLGRKYWKQGRVETITSETMIEDEIEMEVQPSNDGDGVKSCHLTS